MPSAAAASITALALSSGSCASRRRQCCGGLVRPVTRRWRTLARGEGVHGVDLSSPEEYEELCKGAQEVETGTPKYRVSLEVSDPIVRSLLGPRVGATEVRSLEMLQSRWNGNELLRYETDKGRFCVKMNRVEPVEVFTAESLGLVSMAKACPMVRAPKPLDLGVLPRVGEFGPGSFMVMEWVEEVPFGVWRPGNQTILGRMLAEMHLGSHSAFSSVHQGRFGFPVNNWLSIYSQPNEWTATWPGFFAMRLQKVLDRAYSQASYAGAAGDKGASGPLFGGKDGDEALRAVGERLIGQLDHLLGEESVRPALVHGDLWIGNVIADKDGPVLIDPACYFGHAEVELSIMSLFGGFTQEFHDTYHGIIPKTAGFEVRQKVYQAYHWISQFTLFGDPRAKDTALVLMRQVLGDCQA